MAATHQAGESSNLEPECWAFCRSPTFKEQLSSHIEAKYTVRVHDVCKLDETVFRVDGEGFKWVARLFSPSIEPAVLQQDAAVLRFLKEQNFPAERLWESEPVSTMPTGHHIMLTVFIEGRRPRKGEQLFPRLGDLLGRLHNLQPPADDGVVKKGGAWHHLCHSGDIKDENEAILSLMDAAKPRVQQDSLHLFDSLRRKMAEADNFSDLPQCFIHPDFVPSNSIISTADESIQMVDWLGAGIGPRIVSLGYLVGAAGLRSPAQVKGVVTAYSKHVSLGEGEIARLESAMMSKLLVISCWEFCTGRATLGGVVGKIERIEAGAKSIAQTVRGCLE